MPGIKVIEEHRFRHDGVFAEGEDLKNGELFAGERYGLIANRHSAGAEINDKVAGSNYRFRVIFVDDRHVRLRFLWD